MFIELHPCGYLGFIGDTDSPGKVFSTCALQQMKVPLWRVVQKRSIWDVGMLQYSGFFLTCCFWVPLDSKEEKTWLFGPRA